MRLLSCAVSGLRAGLLAVLLLGAGPAVPVLGQTPAVPDRVTFSADNAPQFIVVRNFRVTELQPTGTENEYALTLLALTNDNEPDQRVVGGILFEVDGKSTVVPFQQGGVGDLVVKAQPDAEFITLRAVDSNVTQKVPLPQRRSWVLWMSGPVVILIIALAVLRRRRKQKKFGRGRK